MKVLLTGGGTAGHINPALAIAELIRANAPSSDIAFVGIRGGKEADLIPREGYPLYYVRSKGILRAHTPAALLSNVYALWLAAASPYYPSTKRILDDFAPDIVIGTGGYACWPIMAAAARRGIPTALHESNALPGLAIRRLQDRVDRIWTNFEKTADLLQVQDTVRQVGNPLRSAFATLERQEAKARLGLGADRRMVLCFGGSLGAENVNLAALEMMKRLAPENPTLVFCLASGKRDYEATKKRFVVLGLSECSNCILTDYLYDMPVWMAAAELAVSRAGAMTLSELARTGTPAVLIPSPYVADNHQFLNARAVEDAGGAVLLEESALSGEVLADTVERLMSDPARLQAMSKSVAGMTGEDAGRLIWEDIVSLTGKRK